MRTNRGCRVRPQARRRRRKPGTAPGTEGSGKRDKTAHAACRERRASARVAASATHRVPRAKTGLNATRVGWWPAVRLVGEKRSDGGSVEKRRIPCGGKETERAERGMREVGRVKMEKEERRIEEKEEGWRSRGWRGEGGGAWATGVAADSRLVVVVAKAEGEREAAEVVAAAAANIKSLAHAWCIH